MSCDRKASERLTHFSNVDYISRRSAESSPSQRSEVLRGLYVAMAGRVSWWEGLLNERTKSVPGSASRVANDEAEYRICLPSYSSLLQIYWAVRERSGLI